MTDGDWGAVICVGGFILFFFILPSFFEWLAAPHNIQRELAARAEKQHAWALDGDPRGIYGEWPDALKWAEQERAADELLLRPEKKPTDNPVPPRPSEADGWTYRTGVSRRSGRAWAAWFPPPGSGFRPVWDHMPNHPFRPGAQF